MTDPKATTTSTGGGKPKRRRLRCLLRWTGIALLCLIVLAVGAFIYAWCAFPFPMHRLEDWPSSPRVTDRSGRTLLDLVAEDQQWRFPVALSEVSPWVVKATIAVEDHRFREHLGVDPWAVARANN